MKKAQTEMMGLVILVIIISIAAVFALSFILSSKEETKEDIKLNIQAASLVNSLINLDSGDIKFTDKMIACCDSNDCGFFNSEVPNLIKEVLPYQDYELIVSSSTKTCFKNPSKCNKGKISGSRSISKEQGSYNFMVALCMSS